MGFRSSPYIACKLYGWSMDIIRGNRHDAKNPFKWDSVRINLPGSASYDPQLPWIAKMSEGKEASDTKVYVDDVRPFGSSELKCRATGKRASKITQYLGEQDAARKYRPPSQEPGPWCGSFVTVKDENVYAYVSQKNWEKAKAFIMEWTTEVNEIKNEGSRPLLNHKRLEQGRGFLVYLSRTYRSIVPYLKGIHLTLDSWRNGRDAEGWKLSLNARRGSENEIGESATSIRAYSEAPKTC